MGALMDKVTYVSRSVMDRYYDRLARRNVALATRLAINELRVERLLRYLKLTDEDLKSKDTE